MKTTTYFEVQHGNGLIGKNSTYYFATEKEAVDMAMEFKNNPRSHNPKMEDSNVKYWANETYKIVRKTIETEELKTI